MEELLRDQFEYNAMNHNKQIVCISQQYWDEPWFRKQHFMNRFVQKGYKVAYIEPSFSMLRRPNEGKRDCATNRLFSISIEQKKENLFIIKPPRGIPFWTHPFISRINFYYFAYKIKKVLNDLDFKDFIRKWLNWLNAVCCFVFKVI